MCHVHTFICNTSKGHHSICHDISPSTHKCVSITHVTCYDIQHKTYTTNDPMNDTINRKVALARGARGQAGLPAWISVQSEQVGTLTSPESPAETVLRPSGGGSSSLQTYQDLGTGTPHLFLIFLASRMRGLLKQHGLFFVPSCWYREILFSSKSSFVLEEGDGATWRRTIAVATWSSYCKW